MNPTDNSRVISVQMRIGGNGRTSLTCLESGRAKWHSVEFERNPWSTRRGHRLWSLKMEGPCLELWVRWCYGMNNCVPPEFMCENPNPQLFGIKRWDPWEVTGSRRQKICTPIKAVQGTHLSLYHVKAQGEDVTYVEQTLPRHWIHQHLHLWFPCQENSEKEKLLFLSQPV